MRHNGPPLRNGRIDKRVVPDFVSVFSVRKLHGCDPEAFRVDLNVTITGFIFVRHTLGVYPRTGDVKATAAIYDEVRRDFNTPRKRCTPASTRHTTDSGKNSAPESD